MTLTEINQLSYFDFKMYTQMLWNLEKEIQEAKKEAQKQLQ